MEEAYLVFKHYHNVQAFIETVKNKEGEKESEMRKGRGKVVH